MHYYHVLLTNALNLTASHTSLCVCTYINVHVYVHMMNLQFQNMLIGEISTISTV